MILLAFVFLALSVAEVNYSIPDAIILLIISATYFRGWQTKDAGYGYAATLLAVIFSTVEILSAFAGYVDSLILNSHESIQLTPAMLAIFTMPLLKLKRFL